MSSQEQPRSTAEPIEALVQQHAAQPRPENPEAVLYDIAMSLRDLGTLPSPGVRALMAIARAWSFHPSADTLLKMMKSAPAASSHDSSLVAGAVPDGSEAAIAEHLAATDLNQSLRWRVGERASSWV